MPDNKIDGMRTEVARRIADLKAQSLVISQKIALLDKEFSSNSLPLRYDAQASKTASGASALRVSASIYMSTLFDPLVSASTQITRGSMQIAFFSFDPEVANHTFSRYLDDDNRGLRIAHRDAKTRNLALMAHSSK